MDFGHVPGTELSTIDFSLPPEPAGNRLVLTGAKVSLPMVYMGCPRWGDKTWLGRVFPKGTRDTNFLDHYVKHFNCIELNATHYKIYSPEAIGKWAAKAAGKDFKFCPKIPQSISHYSDFNNVFDETTAFLEGVLAFGPQLGPIFLQVSEKYSPARRDALFRYLRSLPSDMSFFLEVRHPDWFASEAMKKELFDTLRSLNIGAVITDTAGRRDCAHMHLTVPKAFVRFVTNLLHPTDYTRADVWVDRIANWLNQGLQELYFFVHMPDEAYCPELIAYIIDKLNPACGLNLRKPSFIQPGQPAAGTQISFFD
jgi:uncharacterized protein YecE (DUF72 family)